MTLVWHATTLTRKWVACNRQSTALERQVVAAGVETRGNGIGGAGRQNRHEDGVCR